MKRRRGGERKSEQEVVGLMGGERGSKRGAGERREREGEGGRETGKTAP